jgi:hypothetical protein
MATILTKKYECNLCGVELTQKLTNDWDEWPGHEINMGCHFCICCTVYNRVGVHYPHCDKFHPRWMDALFFEKRRAANNEKQK